MPIIAPILLAIEAPFAIVALGLSANTLHRLVQVYDAVNDRGDDDGDDEGFDHARILLVMHSAVLFLLAMRLFSMPFFFLARFCRAVRNRIGKGSARRTGAFLLGSWLYTVLLFAFGMAAWILYGMWIGLTHKKLRGRDAKDGVLYVWNDLYGGGKGNNSYDLARAALAFWVLATLAALLTSISLIVERRNANVVQREVHSRDVTHVEAEQQQEAPKQATPA